MNDRPLVLCLTNTVAANFTANCLLAIGAKPAMIEEPAEAAELATASDALLVNIGTLTARQAEAMRTAVTAANERNVPWVLDPVGVQCSSFRREAVVALLGLKPTIIRGNHAEIDFLPATDAVTLSTGETDVIRQPRGQVAKITGGEARLQSVTATGCAQGGICAAFLGRGLSPFEAAAAASRLVKRAGEIAGSRTRGPGSFSVAFVDALWELSHD